MKKFILTLSLLMATSTLTYVSIDTVPTKKSRLSDAYHKTCDKVCKHKGKACFAAGAIGATLLTRAFSHEWNTYVKPFIKSVLTKTKNFFKRIFNYTEPKGV